MGGVISSTGGRWQGSMPLRDSREWIGASAETRAPDFRLHRAIAAERLTVCCCAQFWSDKPGENLRATAGQSPPLLKPFRSSPGSLSKKLGDRWRAIAELCHCLNEPQQSHHRKVRAHSSRRATPTVLVLFATTCAR